MNEETVKESLRLYAEKLTDNFHYFLTQFWEEIIEEELEDGWHIKYICDELQKVTPNIIARKPKLHDLLINVPPGSTKTTITTIMYPAWLWALDPTLRIISNSYSGGLATDHASKSKDIITSSKYQKLFPHVRIRKDMSGKRSYGTTRNGERRISSTGGTVTGRHAHVILDDDPQNVKQAESEKYRKASVLQAKTLANRKTKGDSAVTIRVMQRLHRLDVSGWMLETQKSKIKHIKIPVMITEGTKPIPAELEEFYVDGLMQPSRFNMAHINEQKDLLGNRQYNGQMLQNPTVEEGDIIKKAWLEIVPAERFSRMVNEMFNKPTVDFFIDTAYTEDTENDPTGIWATCFIDGVVYVVHRQKFRLNFPNLIKRLPEYVNSKGYSAQSVIKIEPKASGKSVVQALRAGTQLNVSETPNPEGSKKDRLYGVSPKIESGRLKLVEGNWNDDVIQEISGFPNEVHDEDVDLAVYAINHYTEEGISVKNILW